MKKLVAMGLLILCFTLVGSSLAVSQSSSVEAVVAFPNLIFNLPVDIQNAGDGSDRLFVVEQFGTIRVFENRADVSAAPVFLDISERVLANDRFGMLGMTFHPHYDQNGYFYVHYTAPNPDRSVIARFSVSSSNPDIADPDSELVILEVEQPHKFHNGGQIAFGPDGYLYIGFGDGGPGRDPNGHGQNRATLLGSFVRIDVNATQPGLNYAIPIDNPFFANAEGYREEIWAWGFRNPWRFSFDPETGRLWSGENGEDRFEEINLVEMGKNYGWSIMEASACFNPSAGCPTAGLELPVHQYGGNANRRSNIGGYVYRGETIPELTGRYIFGDFLVGNVWALEYDEAAGTAEVTTLVTNLDGIGTFGLDEAGEIYIGNLIGGQIYTLIR